MKRKEMYCPTNVISSFAEMAEDTGWIAGLLEGEGCFTFGTSQGKKYPRIKLSMNDRDIVERFVQKAKVSCRVTARARVNTEHATSYTVTVCKASEVKKILIDIYPLMGQRRQGRILQLLLHLGVKSSEMEY